MSHGVISMFLTLILNVSLGAEAWSSALELLNRPASTFVPSQNGPRQSVYQSSTRCSVVCSELLAGMTNIRRNRVNLPKLRLRSYCTPRRFYIFVEINEHVSVDYYGFTVQTKAYRTEHAPYFSRQRDASRLNVRDTCAKLLPNRNPLPTVR